jgi:uncharacterized membrane protein
MNSLEFIGWLRVIYLTVWCGVIGVHATAFVRSFSKRTLREYDQFWATYCGTGIGRMMLAGMTSFTVPAALTPMQAAYDVFAYGFNIMIAVVMIRQPFWHEDRP